ncbi:MAG TPA: hypothetical protein VG538_10790 [Vicinamibacterales bacterium]|jgi:hypothetical protein|nr:hypothetical protein [Vicinamibacterales bacterium]
MWIGPYVLLLIGLCIGWVARSFWASPAIPASTVFSAAVALFIGWLIQSALRRQGELSKVPIDAVGGLCKRLDELIVDCLKTSPDTKAADPALLTKLRSLANEVTWLCAIAGNLKCEPALANLVKNSHQDLFDAATMGEYFDAATSTAAGHRLRARTLALQWDICQRVLERSNKPKALRRLLETLDPESNGR